MHLLVPFAAPLSETGRQALAGLRLPGLRALLAGRRGERDEGDEYSLSPPHERALARAFGWGGADGQLPFAAEQARALGLDPGDLAFGLLTPVHWHVGTEQVSMADPQAQNDEILQEIEDSSRVAKAVHQAIRNNGELADDPIDVLQSGKSVILRGVVDNDHELRLAEKIARGVEGVAGVDVSGLKVAAGAKELAKEKDQDSGDTVYTVKAGDSLSAIAQKYYGDAMEYKNIAHYNNISNPDLIQVGQKIRIPG